MHSCDDALPSWLASIEHMYIGIYGEIWLSTKATLKPRCGKAKGNITNSEKNANRFFHLNKNPSAERNSETKMLHSTCPSTF